MIASKEQDLKSDKARFELQPLQGPRMPGTFLKLHRSENQSGHSDSEPGAVVVGKLS